MQMKMRWRWKWWLGQLQLLRQDDWRSPRARFLRLSGWWRNKSEEQAKEEVHSYPREDNGILIWGVFEVELIIVVTSIWPIQIICIIIIETRQRDANYYYLTSRYVSAISVYYLWTKFAPEPKKRRRRRNVSQKSSPKVDSLSDIHLSRRKLFGWPSTWY